MRSCSDQVRPPTPGQDRAKELQSYEITASLAPATHMWPRDRLGLQSRVYEDYPWLPQLPQPPPEVPASPSSVAKELPHPQERVACGFSILKPPPKTSST